MTQWASAASVRFLPPKTTSTPSRFCLCTRSFCQTEHLLTFLFILYTWDWHWPPCLTLCKNGISMFPKLSNYYWPVKCNFFWFSSDVWKNQRALWIRKVRLKAHNKRKVWKNDVQLIFSAVSRVNPAAQILASLSLASLVFDLVYNTIL